ncbi:MAG: DUF1924 domain-containing protein [Thermodesulfobacteriota bacterium]
MISRLLVSSLLVFAVFASTSLAETKLNSEMTLLLDSYLAEAQKQDPSIKGFSAEEGKKLFYLKRMHSKKKKERSCTTCHTTDPTKSGKTPVGKVIKPVSPAVNKDRFTETKKVKKWFRRNCKWVLERQCTAKEKGDYITYMMSL